MLHLIHDPFNSRNADTLIHLLKGSLGTGILAMPKAFSRSGYLVGFVGTIVIGIICTYCIHMLLRSHYELCKRKKVIGVIKTLCGQLCLRDFECWLNISFAFPLFSKKYLALGKISRLLLNKQTGSKSDISGYCRVSGTRWSSLGPVDYTVYRVGGQFFVYK